MNVVAQVCSLLDKKKQLFLEYEAATQNLLECDADTAEHYITRREELANEIDHIGEEIGKLCDTRSDGDLMLLAANVRCDYHIVPEEYHEVFQKGQEVQSVIARIAQKNKLVIARLEGLREEAKEGIRLNQNLPKIRKYLNDLTESAQGTGFTGGKA